MTLAREGSVKGIQRLQMEHVTLPGRVRREILGGGQVRGS